MGWPHPDFLLKVLSAKQFQEWQAYYRMEPWGFYVDETRYSVIAASIYRAQGSKHVMPRDFTMKEPEREPSVKEFAEKLKIALGVKN